MGSCKALILETRNPTENQKITVFMYYRKKKNIYYSRCLSGATHGWVVQKRPFSIPNIFHTCPIMMKLDTVIPYLKKIHEIDKSRDTTL